MSILMLQGIFRQEKRIVRGALLLKHPDYPLQVLGLTYVFSQKRNVTQNAKVLYDFLMRRMADVTLFLSLCVCVWRRGLCFLSGRFQEFLFPLVFLNFTGYVSRYVVVSNSSQVFKFLQLKDSCLFFSQFGDIFRHYFFKYYLLGFFFL